MQLYTVYRILVRIRRLKWLWWSLVLLPVLIYSGIQAYQFIDRELCVAEELPFYYVGPPHIDDTLRVAVIGDSWAEYHASLECDTIFCRIAKSLTKSPVKCFSRGHSAKMTKEIYYDMFADRTVEHAWEKDFCTQPLLEQHPDYCVIMAGINDLRLFRSTDYYTGNYRLIIRLLLRNNIRPVVMEMPDVDFLNSFQNKKINVQCMLLILSIWTRVNWESAQTYRDAMCEMLKNTGLKDSILFIPVNHWNTKGLEENSSIFLDDKFHLNLDGYHVLDSCLATDIINDYRKRTIK